MKPDDFTATYGPLADDIAKETGLSREAILGIAAQETGFGDHFIGNNIFGISPSGPRGQYVAQYPSIQHAGQAFVDLVKSRYQDASSGATPEDQVRLISARGYNTNPAYPGAVSRRIATLKGSGDQQQAQSGDDLLARMNKIAPPAAPQPATGGAAEGGGTTTPQAEAPSSDDLMARMNAIAPAPKPAGTAAATTTQETAPPAGVGIGGVPAESAAQTFQRWFGAGGPPAKSSPLADVITSPEAQAADRPAGEVPPSQSDVVHALEPAPNTTYGNLPLSWVARDDKTGALRFAMPSALRAPLLDIFRGTVGPETTVDPETGKIQYGMSPGANLLTGFGAGAFGRDMQFSGANPLQHLPGGTFEFRSPVVSADELAAAIRRAGETSPGEATAMMSGGAQGAKDDIPTTIVRPGPTGESQASIEASGGYKPGAGVSGPTEGGAPQPGLGGPQAGGAQVTPSAAAQMTPEEIATQRTVADKQWLNQTQQPGVRDTTEHIPGITPNLVEQEQTVTAARELKALKNLNPELSQEEREILDRNTDLRKGFYADTVGSDVTRAADLKAANDKINTDLANVWQGKGEADPANVHTQIQTELAGSAGDLPPLKAAMKQVADSLENAGTDPQAMYRTHRLINYLQSKQGQLANPGYGAGDVQAALTRVKGTLAKTIDDAAPGFGTAMSDYAGARGPIDAAKALQDRENGLYDSRGHMSFLKVHGLVRDIIDAQKWDAPNDPLAGVSDTQMARLKALHDDLKRVASAKDLATAQGSDTAMNAVDIAKAYGKLAGRAGVEGAANMAFGPGVGSMIVRGAENLLRPITSGIAARGQIRRGMEILKPPANPLNPPSP